MKRKTIGYLAPLSLVITLLFCAFYFYAPPSFVVDINSSNTSLDNNEAAFVFSDIPTATGTGTGAQAPAIRVFLSHGDGTYKIGSPGELAAHTHQYESVQPQLPFAEIIALYDDTKLPPGRIAPPGLTVSNTSSTPLPPTLIATNNVQLKKTCSVVPGDSITYIITYEHPGTCSAEISGTIRFTYDSDVFDFVKSDFFKSETPEADQVLNGNVTKTFSFLGNKALSPGEQRNIFVLLETKPSVSTTTVFDPTNVELILDGIENNPDCSRSQTFTDVITGEQVESSHDPNEKTIVQNALCNNDYVEWRIDFQNEGNATEDTVVVTDWIDTLVDFNTVTLVGHHPVPTVLDIQSDPVNRVYKFALFGIDLRGLGQTNASDDQTRGYVIVRAYRKKFDACNTIANAARILFGCNPPVFTKTALAPFPCQDSICTDCTILTDTTLAPKLVLAPGEPIFSPQDMAFIGATLPAGPWFFKWYPATNLSDPFALNPTVNQAVNRRYTLVASDSTACRRVIIRVQLKPQTPLTLNTSLVNTGTCPDNPLWNLTAVANGAPATHLMWQNCASGVDTYQHNGLDPGSIYVAVWDTITDQYVEQWIPLPHSCLKPPKCPGKGVLIALGIIVLAAMLFNYFKRK